jgi:hypothetical protein
MQKYLFQQHGGGTESQAIRYSKGGTAVSPPHI